ncbi:MAG TPA: lytic transglycosylase domain-containing protein [Thermoanaerobaculia bacterium]|nr:lytic transglycosylase domain-containing protein [Thermoanaerobaculia bacterium]
MKKIAALAAFLCASRASASIALFTDGRSMKISGYKLVDQNAIQLTFKNGGAMTMALTRIERILDDEVIEMEAAPEVKKMIEEGVFPKQSWHYDAKRGPIFRSKYDKLIVEAGKKFDVDAALISAVIKAESDFNPREISNKGARGLMQLMPATAERFGVLDAFNARANINGGARYLRWLLDTFSENADLAVAAYNAGEGNVSKYSGVPPFRETLHYIRRVAQALLPAPAQIGVSAPHQTAVASVSSGAAVTAVRN